ncbi:MAG: hypothetical protein KDD43_12370, partial [Bdellovibrionales bacterium]|nr:hypothetical protein [Bdellovibrionales bacterium]
TQIKPGDLVQRINEAIKRINQVDRELAQDLDGKEAAFNKFKSRLGPTQQAREREMFLLIEDMSEIRKQIQLKSRRLEQIRDDFARKNKGITAIRSIDPTWSQVEEIKMDYDLARQQVEALSQNYAKKAESFALSLKEGTEESRQ